MESNTGAIVTLDGLRPVDAACAGAKAAKCARLKQAGFRVPDGLVVLPTAGARDLAELAVHPWFDAQPPGARFAVRSSGIGEDGEGASFAGIHQTRLQVARADVTAAVEECRASGRSSTALEYRRAKAISVESIEMAVLVQRMVEPIAAGVAFTINPITGADTELVINASWGLAEALVSGQVDPDEIVVRKADGDVVWSRIGEKSADGPAGAWALSPDQIRELAATLTCIERHYGTPQDVEWCLDDTGFWVVQSRPITTERARPDETEWTRANLAEVLPDLTSPQALAALDLLMNQAERHFLGRLVAPERRLGPLVRSFQGRLYFNLSQLRRICALGGVAPAAMLRSLGHAGAIQPSDERTPRPSLEQLRHAPDLLRMLWRHMRAAAIVRDHRARTRAFHARLVSTDPRPLSDAALWTVLDRWLDESVEYMQPVLLLGNVLFHELPVRKVCERVGFRFEDLVYPQLAAGEPSISAQQAFDLVALAEVARQEPEVARVLSGDAAAFGDLRVALRTTAFLAALDRFLAKYGHRGRYEYDWSLPRYSEDPTPLLLAIGAHLEAPAGRAPAPNGAQKARDAARAWTTFEQTLTAWQRWTVLPVVRRSIRRIKQYYVWREEVRSDLVRVIGALRTWHLILADRFVERGWLAVRDDYFMLRLPEIGELVAGRRGPDALRPLVAERRAERARHAAIQMPLLMRESDLPALVRLAGISGGADTEHELHGLTVSGGCVEAEVVVVRDPGDFGRMKAGTILVAPATDPSWTPLFTLASGIIVEVGGVLSHASTIAREYGLPALANVRHATRRLRTGDRVRLDATHGVVHRLTSPSTTIEVRD